MPVIALNELSRSFGKKPALDRVTAELPGGAMGLLGPNGAGKTTLLKILLGLLPANGGSATVLGLDTARNPIETRRRVGYMPEADCTIPRMTGVRLTAFAGELSGLPRREALTRAHEVLHYTGLGEVRYRKADEYSQGMRQRLRLAQALVHDPDLLFLDEPTSGLDPAGRREMLLLIADLTHKQGKHVLLSSHLLPDVEEVCTHVTVLNRGRLATTGSLSDLYGHRAGQYEARITGDLNRLLTVLREAGLEAETIANSRITLALPEGPLPLFSAALAAGAQIRELREMASTLEDALLTALSATPGGEG
jgi:ABC-2 type transport system ATP-binding protein